MGHYPQWGIIDAGINKDPSTEQGFQRTQEPAFLNASTNDAPGIREMEEFDITNLAAPNADRATHAFEGAFFARRWEHPASAGCKVSIRIGL